MGPTAARQPECVAGLSRCTPSPRQRLLLHGPTHQGGEQVRKWSRVRERWWRSCLILQIIDGGDEDSLSNVANVDFFLQMEMIKGWRTLMKVLVLQIMKGGDDSLFNLANIDFFLQMLQASVRGNGAADGEPS